MPPSLRMEYFHIEIIKTRSGPRLVEVNPRLMGGLFQYYIN